MSAPQKQSTECLAKICVQCPESETQFALTVSTLAIYIVPGTAPATHLSSSVEFSSIFDMVFAATEGVAVPSA